MEATLEKTEQYESVDSVYGFYTSGEVRGCDSVYVKGLRGMGYTVMVHGHGKSVRQYPVVCRVLYRNAGLARGWMFGNTVTVFED